MAESDDEEKRLRAVALQNANSIHAAREKAERDLARERERLRITLASIGDAVISTDAEGRVTFLNGVAEALTGWSQAEAAGRPLPDVFRIVNEHTRKTVENPALQALRDGVIVGLANHTILLARDGTERPIDDSAAPMRDEAGTPVGAVLVFRDVTERKQAEEAQLRLASIVESSDDAILSKTLDGIIRTWNRGAERIFGHTAAEAVGKHITLIIPPDRHDEERDIIDRLRRGERIEHFETVRVAKDGRRLDISLTVSPLRNPEGVIVGASKVARDVTEQKRAAAQLRAGEEKFRTLFESIDQGFCVIELVFDRDGRPVDYVFLETNPAFERHTGLRDAPGKSARTMVPGLEADWYETYGRVARTGEPARIEGIAASMDGRWFDVYAFRLGGSGSRKVAVLFSDVTARKRAEHDRERLLREVESERERLADVFQRAPSFMCVLRGPEHVFERANDQYYQVVGHRDIIGKPAREALPEVEGQGYFELLDRVYQTGEAFVGSGMPVLLQRSPGAPPEERFVDVVYQPLRDPDGAITGLLAQGIDITDRKRAEAELRTKTERLNLLVENTRDYAVVVSDLDGTVVEWQGGAERITGFPAAEAIGQKGDLIFTPGDRAAGRPEEEMRRAARDGRAEDRRWHLRKDGSLFFADGVMTALYDSDGKLRGFGKVFKDATAEERAKESRREHTERLRRLADVSARLNAVLDLESVLGVVTAEGRALIGAHQAVTEIAPDSAEAVQSFSFSDELGMGERVVPTARTSLYGAVADGQKPIRLTHGELRAHRGWEGIRAAAERPPPVRGLLAVPIVGPSGGALGVIQLSDKYAGDFTEDDEAILVQFAQMAAVAIENTRLYQALRDEHRLVETLNAIGTRLAAELDLGKLLQAVTDEATALTGAAFGAFFYNGADEKGAALLLYTLSGAPREAFARFPHPRATAIFEPTFKGRGPVRLDDVTADPRFGHNAPYHGMPEGHLPVRSYLAVSVKSRTGEVLGGLFFGHPEAGVFTARHERLVVGLAAQAAVAIDNARLYERLKDQDRRKDDFLALLAHELRNPLAPIRNGLQVVRLSPDRAARERAQEMMDRQLAHMVRLIDDLLDVSRISRNKMELRRARITLSDAVSSAVETARPSIEAAGHELAIALPAEPVFLDADLTRLAQVFSNLLTNSAKYTEAGGRIRLAARVDGGEAVVTVTDNGIGIPAEALPRVFDMFSQVDRSIERATGGLGIGLALVRGLVEMHGGTVSAASGGQGQGSEFTVRLPVLPGHADGSAERSEPAVTDSAPRRRILVVDDNHDSAESMGEMLRLFGNEVALAHDGLAAVERAGAFRPDVILMDVGMPKLNGLDATRRIREQPWGKAMTIIALTGWGQEGDRAQTRDAGCNGHLVKPVSLADLQKLLGALV